MVATSGPEMLRGVLSRVSPSALLVKVRLRQSVTARTRTGTSWACGTAPYEPAVTPVTGFVPESSGAGPSSSTASAVRIALPLQHTHRSTNPLKVPPGEAQRSTTESTRPGVRSPRRCPRSRSHAHRSPSATTSTRPSARLVAAPTSPSSSALARTHQRKPTPCTWPRTHAVSLTCPSGCSAAPVFPPAYSFTARAVLTFTTNFPHHDAPPRASRAPQLHPRRAEAPDRIASSLFSGVGSGPADSAGRRRRSGS